MPRWRPQQASRGQGLQCWLRRCDRLQPVRRVKALGDKKVAIEQFAALTQSGIAQDRDDYVARPEFAREADRACDVDPAGATE